MFNFFLLDISGDFRGTLVEICICPRSDLHFGCGECCACFSGVIMVRQIWSIMLDHNWSWSCHVPNGGLIFCICEYTHAHTLHVHILVITIHSFLSISIVTFCCHTQSFCLFHTRAFMSLGVISALRTSV